MGGITDTWDEMGKIKITNVRNSHNRLSIRIQVDSTIHNIFDGYNRYSNRYSDRYGSSTGTFTKICVSRPVSQNIQLPLAVSLVSPVCGQRFEQRFSGGQRKMLR